MKGRSFAGDCGNNREKIGFSCGEVPLEVDTDTSRISFQILQSQPLAAKNLPALALYKDMLNSIPSVFL